MINSFEIHLYKDSIHKSGRMRATTKLGRFTWEKINKRLKQTEPSKFVKYEQNSWIDMVSNEIILIDFTDLALFIEYLILNSDSRLYPPCIIS